MVKKYKNGLVLGKFMPVQMGHCYLIDMAAEQCETTYVMVCSIASEPIDGEQRYKWVKHIFRDQPNVKVIWCNDENPLYPHECESKDIFYNNYWVPSVKKYVPELDVVFTSEEYGDEFAQYLGIKHELVDQPRGQYAVSATAIRTNPYENWRYIPKSVRSYFSKKIVFMGTESVGKSTITRKLAYYFNTEYVKEYGREYCEIHGTKDLTTESFSYIAGIHFSKVEEKHKKGEKILFVDTEAMTTKIFGEKYLGDKFDPTVINEIIDKQHFDIYFVLDCDVPWVDDGSREFPNGRQEHTDRIIKELTDRGLPYILVSGTYHQRFDKIIREIEKLGNLYC